MFLAVSGLAYFSYLIYELHAKAKPIILPVNQPILFPPKTADNPDPCNAAKTGFQRLQLQNSGKIMIGLSLDWQKMVPAQASAKLGHYPAVYNTFMEMNMDTTPPYDFNSLNWFGSEVGKVGGILEVTMAPTSTLPELSDAVLDQFAQQLYDINSRYGVPVLLRWGHEMNGDWTFYGYQPTVYIQSFRRVADHVRKYTNATAMVWAPNIGVAYPFTVSPGSPSPPPTSGPDLALLDTNGNGRVDQGDDPYLPYYPGDAYVDWVGLSLYYYPFTEDNVATPPTYFVDSMLGTGPTVINTIGATAATPAFSELLKFYNRFAAAKNRPMMLPETGAPYLQGLPTVAPIADSEVNIKMSWWNQVLSADTLRQFPLLQLAVNFEENKTLNGFNRDWRLLENPTVLNSFKNKYSTFSSNLVEGNALKFSCDGSITLK